MTIGITLTVEQQRLQAELRLYGKEIIPNGRQSCMQLLARRILKQIILRNPVETARSRAAWVNALAEMGAVPPAGWQGDVAEQAAIQEGTAHGSATEIQTAEQTEITATNRVDYIPFLEYGTGQTAAFQMVQQSLRQAGITKHS